MKIAASILFDSIYIEPALLTAFELINNSNSFNKIYLLYLSNNDNEDSEVQEIVESFCNSLDSTKIIIFIKINNTLERFFSHHFTNSIIYKSLIPSILPEEPYIINIDAGTMLGVQFDQYMQLVYNQIQNNESNNWIISAHCSDSIVNLPISLHSFSMNKLYPAGVVLLFNSYNYKRFNWFERYISNYNLFNSNLKYAEQELICLTAEENELINLPESSNIKILFLGTDQLKEKKINEIYLEVDNSVYFKFAGSFKPWKYWVLDPYKALYLIRRKKMENYHSINNIELIEKNRIFSNNIDWNLGFLKNYENSLV